ncbi:outer membrane protein [Candidatus Liberibacter brunswickensis]|uniref:outer membrane protein n=1 Tax=Candidatus Liberibacter brunswickensis TaxID=1968796 RepID=UPI002FDF4BF7
MQKFLLAVGVSSITLASFCSVNAADAVVYNRHHNSASRGKVPTAYTNRYVTYQSFVGPYAGLSALYNTDFSKANHDQNRLGGAVYAGYNMQDYGIVYGVEGDVRYVFSVESETKDAADARPYTLNGVSGSLRARGGYEVVDSVLLYGTAGIDVVRKLAGNNASYPLGGTAGVGVEAILADNITGRIEYRLTEYFKEVNHVQNMFSAGVGMKF